MASSATSSVCKDAAPPASELTRHAQRLLVADDLDGFRQLFEQSYSIGDPHQRYWTGTSLIELGLAMCPRFAPARRSALMVKLASAAVEMLEREPSEPLLLNHAGVVLYELWSLDAAEALFDAAQRLDPRLENVPRNLARLDERRRQAPTAVGRPPLRAALPELARRAVALAAAAQPAVGLRLSLCMIVRDEEQILPQCLAAVAGAVDEIVIVDTGSTDATIEIARSFGARVIEREWTGSFADARNVSFDAATGDWLMYLDADEVLVHDDRELLRSLTGRSWREAFYFAQTSYTGDSEDGGAVAHDVLRMFRNRDDYRFEGRLHEQVAHRLPGYLPERIETAGVRIEHYGYLGVVREARRKSDRNIELLRLQQAEGPPNPFLHFNLGCEYAAAGDRPAALIEFERAWSMLEGAEDKSSYKFAPALMNRLVKALRMCGRPSQALVRARQGLELFPGFTDLVLEQAHAAIALDRQDQAIVLLERCIEMGEASRGYTSTVGTGTFLPRLQLAQLKRSSGDLQGAIAQLEHCAREHPRFIGSVLPYASALLESGLEPREVVATIEQHMPDLVPSGRFMLGTALYEAGATSAGEEQFRLVLARNPHSARARVALAEGLLAQRRYAEAAAEAALVRSDDQLAVIACRSELFARMAGDDPPGAAPALEKAQQAGMADAELDLFRAWMQRASTGECSTELAEEALPQLEVMLEALLRVHDFEAFEALLDVFQRSPIGERERRELLAEIYMRRGFAASAAEQWMAVCRQEPDVRALLGLARVAAAHGMTREADDFAGAVLSRDPENKLAASLLSRTAAA
ncbi:MAG TPA: glycosyltransferase [Solirubrobacteraceae bacterium]